MIPNHSWPLIASTALQPFKDSLLVKKNSYNPESYPGYIPISYVSKPQGEDKTFKIGLNLIQLKITIGQELIISNISV